jgi:hypothetical protein
LSSKLEQLHFRKVRGSVVKTDSHANNFVRKEPAPIAMIVGRLPFPALKQNLGGYKFKDDRAV